MFSLLLLHQRTPLTKVVVNDDQQNATIFGLFIYSLSALHVSGDVFAHHQERLTVFTASGNLQFHLIHDTSRQQHRWTLPEAVNIVKRP